MKNWTNDQLEPFGAVITATDEGTHLRDVSTDEIRRLIADNRLVVFRRFAGLQGEDFPKFCSQFGEVLEFDFGVVNELRTVADAKNYLYTISEVPFHWDGAFVGRIPNLIFFHCDHAPASGGETLFTDTTLMLESAPPEIRNKWSGIEITYTTEKVVHYGGTFSSPMITENQVTHETVIRYAEPVVDLNPVYLEIKGIPTDEREAFLNDMHERLNDGGVCYSHAWQSGDLLIADNRTLLHGRRTFDQRSERQIRRVNVL